MRKKKELPMTPTNNPTSPPVQQNSSIQKAFVNKSINSLHSFYLSGAIEDSAEYVAWFEIMRNAGENDVIQIHPNKTVTSTFETGCIYVRYFSRPMDDDNLPMVPEVLEVEEYIKSYLKFKFFEQLWHSVVDESQRQVEAKFQYYRQDQLSKLQAANGYLLTYTKQQMADNVAKMRNRFIKYHIQ